MYKPLYIRTHSCPFKWKFQTCIHLTPCTTQPIKCRSPPEQGNSILIQSYKFSPFDIEPLLKIYITRFGGYFCVFLNKEVESRNELNKVLFIQSQKLGAISINKNQSISWRRYQYFSITIISFECGFLLLINAKALFRWLTLTATACRLFFAKNEYRKDDGSFLQREKIFYIIRDTNDSHFCSIYNFETIIALNFVISL